MRSFWTTTILIFIVVFVSEAQEKISRDKYIDEVIFPTAFLRSDINSLLESGFRGFIIDESSVVNDDIVSDIGRFLDDHPEEFIGFIQMETEDYTGDLIYSRLIQRIIYIDKQYLPLCDSLLFRSKQILFFSSTQEEKKMMAEDYLTYAEVGIRFPHFDKHIFTKFDPGNLFTIFRFNKDHKAEIEDSTFVNTDLPSSALNFVRKTGKIPNFMLTDNPSEVRDFYDGLPSYFKLTVVNSYGNQITDVRFKEFKKLSTKGITHILAEDISVDSTLFFNDKIRLTSYKNGYQFVPEIYTFNYNNYNLFKTILAQRINMGKDLQINLPLSGKNLFHSAYPVEIISSTLAFMNDREHKKVAVFDGATSGIYLGPGNMKDLEESFSIFLWAKPDSVAGNFPFFSKAGSYCLKIRNEHLCFTVVDITDLVSDNSPLEKDKWQHIGLVYEKSDKISYYVDGALTDVIPAIDYAVAESGFIIGTNQWDEYYKGAMSDVLVWNRALGADEVRDLYEHGIEINIDKTFVQSLFFKLSAAILAIMLIATYFIFRKRKARKVVLTLPGMRQSSVQNELNNYIRCFGEFAIFDDHGNNLAEKLSSKKRSLLLVVLYYTLREGGISPGKLADTFWPGYHSQRAKNVRGTYIQEIRSILPEDLLSITYDNKKWKVRISTDIQCDLADILFLEKSLVKESGNGCQFEEDNLNRYLQVLRKGNFADGISNEYTDAVKQEVTDIVTDRLEMILKVCTENSRDDLVLNIVDVILDFDPLHEEVFKQKMDILLKQNNKHEAQKCFEKFTKTWVQYFDEPYPMKFADF